MILLMDNRQSKLNTFQKGFTLCHVIKYMLLRVAQKMWLGVPAPPTLFSANVTPGRQQAVSQVDDFLHGRPGLSS